MLSNKNIGKSSEFKFKMFIDFDAGKKVFYHNYFFEEFKFVLKIALIPPPIYEENNYNKEMEKKITSGNNVHMKYEKFELAKYTYILFYE